MIFLDIDGVLVDFYGTAKKFGIELEMNKFGDWKLGEPPYPAPEMFYAKAELQEWAKKLVREFDTTFNCFRILTKDYARIKEKLIKTKIPMLIDYDYCSFLQDSEKPRQCKRPFDLLIDDNPAECEAWRGKGGMAYWFDLASKTPFEDFLKWWRMEK